MHIEKLTSLTKRMPILLMGAILIVSIISAGCTDIGEQEKNMPNESLEPAILNAAMVFGPDKGGNLDPGYGWEGWYVRKAGIYETLFSYDPEMRLQPELAIGYDLINDTNWEIDLREGVKFHDGTPLNADAVIFSINRIRDENNSRHLEYDFIEDISKEDEYTVIITTKEPYAPTIASLTDPVVSIVSPKSVDIESQPVGTGPFMFESFRSGASLTVNKNPNYWGGVVKLDGVKFQYNKDPIARSLMLSAGDVDIARAIPSADFDIINANPNFEVLSKETLRTYFMYVNCEKAPLNDVKVRQAINYAIDREELVNTALEGVGGKPAKSIFPGIFPWSANDELEGYQHTKEKALEMFAEAGITSNDEGQLVYNGEPFTLEIQTYSSRPELQPSAEAMAAQLEAIGISASVKIAESSAIQADMADGNYDLALYAWGVAPSGDPDYFLTKHFVSTESICSDWTHYSNPQVDEWIVDARSTMDQDIRKEIYDQVQIQVVEDSPEIFVFYSNELVAQSTEVKGYEIFPNEISFMTKDIFLQE